MRPCLIIVVMSTETIKLVLNQMYGCFDDGNLRRKSFSGSICAFKCIDVTVSVFEALDIMKINICAFHPVLEK